MQILFTECTRENHKDYSGHDIPYSIFTNTKDQPDVQACINHCAGQNAPFFTYHKEASSWNQCACKSSRAGRKFTRSKTVSGVADGCAGEYRLT